MCVFFSSSKQVGWASPNPCWRPPPYPFHSNIHTCYSSYSWEKIIYALIHEYFPAQEFPMPQFSWGSRLRGPHVTAHIPLPETMSELCVGQSNFWSDQIPGPLFSVIPKGHQHLLVASRWACYVAWPFREKVLWLLTLEDIENTYAALMKTLGKWKEARSRSEGTYSSIPHTKWLKFSNTYPKFAIAKVNTWFFSPPTNILEHKSEGRCLQNRSRLPRDHQGYHKLCIQCSRIWKYFT